MSKKAWVYIVAVLFVVGGIALGVIAGASNIEGLKFLVSSQDMVASATHISAFASCAAVAMMIGLILFVFAVYEPPLNPPVYNLAGAREVAAARAVVAREVAAARAEAEAAARAVVAREARRVARLVLVQVKRKQLQSAFHKLNTLPQQAEAAREVAAARAEAREAEGRAARAEARAARAEAEARAVVAREVAAAREVAEARAVAEGLVAGLEEKLAQAVRAEAAAPAAAQEAAPAVHSRGVAVAAFLSGLGVGVMAVTTFLGSLDEMQKDINAFRPS